MAKLIIISGKSGSGVSFSMKNLDPKTNFIINTSGKDLPFSSEGYKRILAENGMLSPEANYYESDDPVGVTNLLKFINTVPRIKSVCIDPLSYIVIGEVMSRAEDTTFGKDRIHAKKIHEMLKVISRMRPDINVYLLTHQSEESEAGTVICVPGGKMVRDNLQIEGMAVAVLTTQVDHSGNGQNSYHFLTQNNGFNTTKSPEGMFPEYRIPNDLQRVDIAMRRHYEPKFNPSKILVP